MMTTQMTMMMMIMMMMMMVRYGHDDEHDDEHDGVMSNPTLKLCCSSQPGMRCRSLRFAGLAGVSSDRLREVKACYLGFQA